MKNFKPFALGALTMLIALAITAFIIYKNAIGSVEVDPYPMGSGKHELSPDGLLRAHASNMHDKTFSGTVIDYFEFRIVDVSSGEPLVVHRFPQGESKVIFRSGNGLIAWSQDSKEVAFGSQDEELWSFKITNKPTAP